MRARAWLVIAALSSLVLASTAWSLLLHADVHTDWNGEPIRLLRPELLAALGVWPVMLWSVGVSLTDLPLRQRLLSLATRTLLLAAVTLALARPARTQDATRVSVIFLVDVSDSVTDVDLDAAQKRINAAIVERGDNDVQVVTFAARPRSVPIDEKKGEETGERTGLGKLSRHAANEGAATNIQAALQLSYGLFPAGHVRRAVVLSDGAETHGDLISEIARARTFGVPVSLEPMTAGRPAEVAITSLTLPDPIDVGEPFVVRAQIYATAPGNVRVKLYQGALLNGLDGVRDVPLSVGHNDIEFESVVRIAGAITYRLEIQPGGADAFTANNTFSTTAVVPGRPSVLIVEGDPRRASYLAEALTAAEYEVDVRGSAALPRELRDLSRYDFFILSDIPAEQVSLQQMDVIERYVRDVGGGFLMAGGDRSFGLGGYAGTRLEELLPVRMESERRRDEHSLALELVIDCSGSMSGQKIELAKEASKAAAELLGPGDSVGVICFTAEPEHVVRMQSARNRARILGDISRLAARGGTAIFPALDAAFRDLSLIRARVKHVILLTDGQTRETGVTEIVQAMRAESITLSTVGLGGDVNRPLLQEAANLGGGRAYFTNDPHHIPRIFTRETTNVAQNSAVEEYVQALPQDPADFLRGIDIRRAPFLRGYVATQAKPRPAQVILQSELGDPLLARWREGLGWSLAWTSDVKNRWAVDWLRWPGFSRFWGQLVREHMRNDGREQLPMQASIDGDELRVVVDAVDPNDEFVNDLESTLQVHAPSGSSADGAGTEGTPAATETITLRQTAPGRYEARTRLMGHGSYRLHATHRRNDQTVAESLGQIAHPYPLEYAVRPNALDKLTRSVAALDGHAQAHKRDLFDPGDERIKTHQELWRPLVFLAIVLFLFDLLLRRVRLFDRHFGGPKGTSGPVPARDGTR